MKIYQRIEEDFNFPREMEIRARDALSGIIGEHFVGEGDLKKIIGNEVYVVGFSPTLEEEIKEIKRNLPIIAADDAAVILSEHGIKPDIVLTDLDGDVDSLLKLDAVFGIHAHGDNVQRLHLAEKFRKKFGTTQIEPVWNVYDFGGFTDGDRCVFLATHFGARVHIIGFNFEEPRIKEGKNIEKKRKKLKWAKILIEYLEKNGAEIIWESLK